MKKNELKSGMVVEYRDGKKRLVAIDNLIGVDGAGVLPNYNDDLKHAILSDFDIIKVYNYKLHAPFGELLKDDNLELIWEREEIKLTDKEIEILKALKTLGFKLLARDDDYDDSIYAYNNTPYKLGSNWVSSSGENLRVNGDIFSLIKWEDKKPTSIDDLLKGE